MLMWINLNLIDSNSPPMEYLSIFHDNTMLIIMIIMTFISHFLYASIYNKLTNNKLIENQITETTWTIIPALTLLFIAYPSLHLLYILDEINKPLITLKAIGHQWYWTYEYSDFFNIEFDSFMNNMMNMFPRITDTDKRTIIPFKTFTRIIVTASDVIHSWSLPSLGVKIDGTPGRLNQSNLFSKQPITTFGQCSEICGINHSFMPIYIEAIPTNKFIKWMTNMT
uniref:Cytochrome c oxidase subunit 2 n=1 Tax=Aposthonia borneensis TaxID=1208762 RepID=A0A0A0S156_9NEOP|nr:cytochrome c oxidase subunit II [Aposthonia borneensis]